MDIQITDESLLDEVYKIIDECYDETCEKIDDQDALAHTYKRRLSQLKSTFSAVLKSKIKIVPTKLKDSGPIDLPFATIKKPPVPEINNKLLEECEEKYAETLKNIKSSVKILKNKKTNNDFFNVNVEKTSNETCSEFEKFKETCMDYDEKIKKLTS